MTITQKFERFLLPHAAILLVPFLSLVPAAHADERRVCKTGGADFTTIQAAVDAAQPGDVIKVAAATYTEAKLVSATQFNLYITKSVTHPRRLYLR